ncbi:tripartite tricarboxylate transporter substrate binding protein [Mesobacillus selenatarsenatis]|uniref:Tricarboxylate transport protein TctC n=1 Tax=Mesobacillus selenatarsenatis (strain DSM 18680 / JCM 14380 / FERM P-15431 / SF-1) TaxID=1321606 RepID=A0A0A8X6U7_MESS1|nr:tripartite tricarboxylate transporter substrate-binding protein [Mesobacillus selenatarsenatis]GAM15653.1 tricarboxylate transport protein TctC [Mesobacillus selenatarsenatis SF-1]
MKKFLATAAAFTMLIAAGCSNQSSGDGNATGENGEWKPTKPIEITAPAGPGGGWDTTARMASQVFEQEKIIDKRLPVVNKAGGGGAIGWAYIAGKKDSEHNMFVASPPLLLVPLNGQSEYGYEDFTPLANVIADYGAFVVKAEAKWNNLNDLFEDMKKDPASVSVIGTSSPGSMDHMQFVKIAKAAGVDVTKIKYISDPDAGGLTAVLNGSVDVYTTGVAETIEQVKAGKIKVLGITSEERLEGEVLSDFQTAKEQGIDETFVNWRGFFGPPGMDPAAVKYYEEKFKELSDSPAWDEIRKKYGWGELYMDSEEYSEFLKTEAEDMQNLLEELGLSR